MLNAYLAGVMSQRTSALQCDHNPDASDLLYTVAQSTIFSRRIRLTGSFAGSVYISRHSE
jgi:hypothetical protein